MARRTITVNGETWEVSPTGRLTVYGRDQIGLLFQQGTGPQRRRRFTRFTPVGSRGYDAAITELNDRELLELFHASQPAWTAPEGSYGAR